FDTNTLYVADDRTLPNGGVQKWTQSGGSWTLASTLNNGLTAGVRGLTLTTNGSNQPVIYASTADSLSKLVTVTDDGTASPAFPFGAPGDLPVTGDFDGDGQADAAVYRPSSQIWFILRSSGGVSSIPFGINGDIPVPADYDGDGNTDVAIYRPGPGQWWYLRS